MDLAPLMAAGVDVSEDDLETIFSQALAAVVPPYPPLDPRKALPADELTFLQRAGISNDELAPLAAEVAPPEVHTASKLAGILATALSIPDAAARLGVDPSTLRHRLAAPSVYAVRRNGTLRLPLFQFNDTIDAMIPGFGDVAPGLADLHPVDVFNWFIETHVDLEVEDRQVSPREWLLSGGRPERLLALLDELRGVA